MVTMLIVLLSLFTALMYELEWFSTVWAVFSTAICGIGAIIYQHRGKSHLFAGGLVTVGVLWLLLLFAQDSNGFDILVPGRPTSLLFTPLPPRVASADVPDLFEKLTFSSRLTNAGGKGSVSSAQVEPDVVGNAKSEHVDNTHSGWIYTIASLMASLCCVVVGYISRGIASSAPVMSQDVVTHDYVYRVEEHLKGCLSKLTDWCVAGIQQEHKVRL